MNYSTFPFHLAISLSSRLTDLKMMSVYSLKTELNSLISHHNYQMVFYVRICIYPKLRIFGKNNNDPIITPCIVHIDCDMLLVDFTQTQTAEFCGHSSPHVPFC